MFLSEEEGHGVRKQHLAWDSLCFGAGRFDEGFLQRRWLSGPGGSIFATWFFALPRDAPEPSSPANVTNPSPSALDKAAPGRSWGKWPREGVKGKEALPGPGHPRKPPPLAL